MFKFTPPLLGVLLCACLLFAPRVTAEPVFTFTAIPDQDESQLQSRFAKVARYLQQRLGVEVRYIPVKSYAAAITAFRNNQVQLAWFGGLSGVRARSLVPGSRAIAQGIEDTAFKTYFIANTNSGLKPNDVLNNSLRGHTFTFGAKGSTSGRLMPEYFIRAQFNTAPDEVFSRVGFSGDHSRTIALVEAGSFDVGATNYKVWEKAVAEGRVDTSRVQVIWETPTYPDYQWTIRGDVNQQFGKGFEQKVQRVLLDITDPVILESFPRSGFIKAGNADYHAIERTAHSTGLLH